MRRGLGKGLSQFLGEQAETPVSEVEIELIVPNSRQPRTGFDETKLRELADSVAEVGVLQPLIVRRSGSEGYELIAGERRLRAAKLANLTRVPVVVRAASDQNSLELALVENIQRDDIGPLECAEAYRRLVDEFGLTQEQVAVKVGKSRAAVTNALRLLRLPREILDGLQAGKVSEGHARALLMLGTAPEQIALYRAIVLRGLSVRETEQLAQREQKEPRPRQGAALDPDWARLQDGLCTYFGSPVQIQRGRKGGKMVVNFYSNDDLERILELLGLNS